MLSASLNKTFPSFLVCLFRWTDLIYVVGGFSDSSTELKLCHQYNPVTRGWERLLSMRTRRAYVGLAAMDGFLYAVGGWNEHDGSLSSVEKYCIETVSVFKPRVYLNSVHRKQ